ncbi:MAG: threonine-phosphate decarboxylase CobD [Eubacteriales bacterium]|nr:threonine-phosphate decarboxylase CobD [Eubacteriales bacterium]
MKKHIHGGNVYQYENCVDFSANCNPLGTPESVKEAVIKSLENINHYPQVGCAPLKKAIAAYEGTEAESIICGNGAAELIFSLCRAGKPRRALVPAPTFAEYQQALESVGCEVEYFWLREDKGYCLDKDFLDGLHKELDIVFLCNPNNPTGVLTDRGFLTEVLEKCRELEIFLVVDECFLDFVKEAEAYTLKGMLKEYHNLFLLKAFTKRYAMAGVRLGYGICENKKLLEQMELVTQPWNVSSMAQAAGLAALKEKEYVEAGRQIVFTEREYLKKEMTELGLTVFASEANYIFFKGPEDLFEACVKNGILIRDCSNYPGLCKGYFRIAVKRHEDNEKLVRVLREIL